MNTDRAIALQEQAWAFQTEGKLDDALAACREALRLMEQSEGPESPDVANLLNDLAEIQCERQNFTAALELGARSRAIAGALGDRFTGEDAARIRIRTLGLLGTIHRTLGNYSRAEVDLQDAAALARAEFGDGSPEAADTLNNLGVLFKQLGRYDEALSLYRQVLGSTPADSLESATLHHNIGGILHAQGDYTAAEVPARRAWEISRALLGEDDPRTMLDAAAYAAVLDGLERYGESEAIYRRALAIFEAAYGPEHYEVAATLHNLGALLAVRGDYPEAEEHYRRALALKETLLGAGSPDAALTRHNLGNMLSRAGRSAEAIAMLQEAVAVLEKRLPPGHPHLVLARKNLQDAIGAVAAS